MNESWVSHWNRGRDGRHPAGPVPFRARDSIFRGPVSYRWLFLNRILIYSLLSNQKQNYLAIAVRILQFGLCLVVQALTNPRSLLDDSPTTTKPNYIDQINQTQIPSPTTAAASGNRLLTRCIHPHRTTNSVTPSSVATSPSPSIPAPAPEPSVRV